jgi:hypothetical protein
MLTIFLQPVISEKWWIGRTFGYFIYIYIYIYTLCGVHKLEIFFFRLNMFGRSCCVWLSDAK